MDSPDPSAPARKVALRSVAIVSTVLAATLFHAGCTAADPAPAGALRGAFPAHAARVLEEGSALVATDTGFTREDTAAEAEIAPRAALSMVLPRRAGDAIHVSLPGGFEASVREEDASGEGRIEERSVAYQRAGGTAFWTATAAGFEEWLHLHGDGDGRALASWTVTGARLAEVRGVVHLLDDRGIPRARVTAPVAYGAGGRTVPVRLAVEGDRIDLFAGGAPGEELLVDPAWTAAATMISPRQDHTATPLAGGRVLVTGGSDGAATLASAEIYDPRLDAWLPAAPMSAARKLHAATRLADGRVLVAGGTTGLTAFTSAEIYDPAADQWLPAASMSAPRQQFGAAILPNARVLVAGGFTGAGYLAGAEIYDPAGDAWSPAAGMPVPRAAHTLTVLADGRVLAAGGVNAVGVTASASVYDPASGSWSPGGAMSTPRWLHTATLLGSGKVLVAGGTYGPTLVTAEVFDPASGAWSPAGPMTMPRSQHTATLLGDGRVLAAGGVAWVPDTAEAYDPATNAWSPTPSMHTARQGHTATLLGDGKLLVAGGYAGTGVTSSAERWVTAAPTCVTIRRGTSGAVADAGLSAYDWSKNYGASASMATGLVSGTARESLVRFDLSTIPAHATIASAKMTLTAWLVSGAVEPVNVHRAPVPWSESTVTWDTFTGAYSPAVEGSLSAAASGAVASADLTRLVQSWVDGAVPNDGVVLERGFAGSTAFYTSEYNAPATDAATLAKRPRLDVCYVAPGAVEWSKVWPSGAPIADMKTDALGNLVVAGRFSGTVDFGGGVQLTATSASDAYVLTLDASGHPIRGRAISPLPLPWGPTCAPWDLRVNARGELLWWGMINGSPWNCIAKLDQSGALEWQATAYDAYGPLYVRAFALSESGDVAIAGQVSVAMTISGVGRLLSENAVPFWRADGFVVRISPAGHMTYGRVFGTDYDSSGEAVGIDASGTLYLAGGLGAPTDLGDGSLTSGPFVASPGLWSAPGPLAGPNPWLPGFDIPTGSEQIAFDGSGDVLVGTINDTSYGAGYFYPSAEVWKYDRTGALLWSRSAMIDTSAPDYLDLYSGGIAGDALDDVIVAGIGNGTGVALGKYDPAGNLLWSTTLGLAPGGYASMSPPVIAPAGDIYVVVSGTLVKLAP
jgi:hypothetical protein